MSYEFELDEWRLTVSELSELGRIANCTHSYDRNGDCRYCGDSADYDEEDA